MDIFRHDRLLREQGFDVIAGIDEAGRGPIAGPVAAAAVVLSSSTKIKRLRDSKKVPEKEREHLFWEVLSLSRDVGVGIVEHHEIDRLNILNATRLAMQRALDDLSLVPALLIIDAVSLPSVPVRQLSPFRAEAISASVAAASIVAKYVRDRLMLHYHELYPEYDFGRHKGYGTAEHVRLLALHGPSPIHRMSFKPVSEPGLPLRH